MKTKRLFLILCLLCLLFGIMTLSASAATVVESGTLSKGITWKLDSAGTLTISSSVKNGTVSALDFDYYEKQRVNKLVITGSVSKIDANAFYYYANMQTVTLPSSLKSIGMQAFRYCYSLKKITIPSKVTDIGSFAFSDCNSLQTVTLPSGLKSVETATFQNCYQLQKITLPSGVKSIGDCAFWDCSSLQKITISQKVTNIGSSAFCGCSSLQTITIPKKVTNIGSGAFGGCSSLTAINVDKANTKYASVDGILYNKKKTDLMNCPGGKTGSVSVPASVTNTGRSAFGDCYKLAAINVHKSNKTYASVDGILYNKKKTDVILCPRAKSGSVTVPAGVTKIKTDAFSGCTNLQSVKLPNSVTEVESYAFADCTGLQTVTLPSSLKSVGERAFVGCSSLQKITIPQKVTNIGASAFSGCSSLQKITIPQKVTNIGESAFASCSSLQKITIPKKVTAIQHGTFWGCSNLQQVTLPSGLESIGTFAFRECSSLQKITLPNSLEFIGSNAFENCSSLQKLNIPKNVTDIMGYVFDGCTSLTDITVDKANTVYMSYDGVLYQKVVRYNPRIRIVKCPEGKTGTVTILSSMTEVNNGAFRNCSKLESVVFPKKITKIESCAFENCSSLQTITIPNTATEIGAYTFENCTGLQSVTLPKNLKVLEMWTFSGCTSLTSIEIPAKVQKLEWDVFNQSGVKQIYFNGDAPSFHDTAFAGIEATAYYPKGNSTWTKSVRQSYGGNVKWAIATGAVKITEQPKNVYAKLGETAEVTVKAKGHGLTYIWYTRDKGAEKFTKTSAVGPTYSVEMTSKTKDRQVYCVIKDRFGNRVKTKTVALRTALSITTQPETTYTKLNGTTKVTVKATGDGLTYTWYVKNVGATKFSKSSVNKATYAVKMTEKIKDRQVYCVIKDKYGNTVKTDIVYLHMAASISKQPVSVTVAKGAKATVKLTAKGDGLTYKWYFKDPDSSKFLRTKTFTDNSYSLTMSKARSGRQVYCVVTDKYGNSVKSNVVTLKMK